MERSAASAISMGLDGLQEIELFLGRPAAVACHKVFGIPVIIEPFYGVTLSSRPHREDAAACLLSPGMAPSAAALPPVWALVMRRVISADTHLLHADSPGWHNLVPSLSGAARTRRPDR